tara:strand:- start:850 stop:1506 length:657 start_codon:yes stop_codon:yes gene_type:complete
MKISKETLETLKNFATINTNILVREGSTLSTISTGKNIFAKAEVKETFPKEFAIYDLNSLLSLLTLMEDTDLEFGDESLVVSKGSSVFEYFYADPNIIVSAPDQTIDVDDFFQFDFSKDDIDMIMKAAAITAAPMLSIIGENGEVIVTVGDPSTPKSNSFRQVIGTTDKTFNAMLAIENFKVVPASYNVTLSQKKFMYLVSSKGELKYWLALERSSDI